MKNISNTKRNVIIALLIVTLIVTAISLYRMNKIRLMDKPAYNRFCSELETASENFTAQKDLRNYIVNWADTNHLQYKVDKNKNIIFNHAASNRKKNVAPTVIVVGYNYESAKDNRKVLASAAMVAKADLKSGRRTVIFVNNADNDAEPYTSLNRDYFTNKTKVIYLDYGKNAYISQRSFALKDQTISIPYNEEDITCDTAIKIRIGGIPTDTVDTNVTKHTNPITLFSTLLTRLKTKSTICQIADLKVKSHGHKYPTDIEATVLLNSYAVSSFTSYLDKRIESFNKSNKNDDPNWYYEYEILEDGSKNYPEKAYNRSAINSLTTVLYAVKNGSYKYDEDDVIPDGYEAGEVYGISWIRDLREDNNQLCIDISLQGADKQSIDKLSDDNSTAAKIANCGIQTTDYIKAFHSKEDGLKSTLCNTYLKVSDLGGSSDISLEENCDTYFTPMSFLSSINNRSDIVHIKESGRSASVITNMLLCYIQTKGNFLSL